MSNKNDTAINELFTQLESAHKWADHLNHQSLFSNNEGVSREAYGRVFEEALAEINIIQKRLIRAFFKAGEIGELEAHVEVGTLPPYSIHAALNRDEFFLNQAA